MYVHHVRYVSINHSLCIRAAVLLPGFMPSAAIFDHILQDCGSPGPADDNIISLMMSNIDDVDQFLATTVSRRSSVSDTYHVAANLAFGSPCHSKYNCEEEPKHLHAADTLYLGCFCHQSIACIAWIGASQCSPSARWTVT